MLKNLSYKQLFLIDGLGAVLTAVLLSQVLARFETTFGMSRDICHFLAGMAGSFAVYSLSCHCLLRENWKPYLKGIAVANTMYCLVTLGLVIYLFASLTWLGILYFLGEILVVLGLAAVEFSRSAKVFEQVPA